MWNVICGLVGLFVAWKVLSGLFGKKRVKEELGKILHAENDYDDDD